LMSRVFGEEIAPYLETIMPELLKSCQSDETADAEEEEDIDVTDDEDSGIGIKLNTAIADEKEIAADCIGELFENTRSHFLPYLASCVNELVQLLEHYSDGVRKATIGSLFSFLTTVYLMSDPVSWEQGLPLKIPVHENVTSIVQMVVPAVLKAWEEEDDRMVAVQIQQEFVEALKIMGPVVVAGNEAAICTQIQAIFENKAFCQQDQVDEEGAMDEDEQAEHEALLISAACDLIGTLALDLGPDFVSTFHVFLPYLMKNFHHPKRSSADRCAIVGALSDVTVGLNVAVTEFTEKFYSVFLKSLDEEEGAFKTNSVFGLGVLVEHTTVDMSSQFPVLLQAISPFFQDQKLPQVTDNACGCLARMILKHPQSADLEQTLPALIHCLPLKQDFYENEPVYRCLCALINAGNPAVAPFLGTLRHLFVDILAEGPEKLKEQTRELIMLAATKM